MFSDIQALNKFEDEVQDNFSFAVNWKQNNWPLVEVCDAAQESDALFVSLKLIK